MIIGIYKQHLGGFHKAYLDRYVQILNYNGIEYVWLDCSTADFWEKVAQLDLFIYQWEHYDQPGHIARTILPIIQYEMKITCFPDWTTSWHFDDKIKQYYLLKLHGFPITESFIFWEKEVALDWLSKTSLPLVFKLKGGAGSSNVVLVKTKANAVRLIDKMFGNGIKSGSYFDLDSLNFKKYNLYRSLRRTCGNLLRRMLGTHSPLYWQVDKNYVLFQKYLPGNIYDTRVTVIGDRAFAFRRFNRDNDFRASGSGKIDYDTSKVDLGCIELAFRISNTFNFQVMAYDFLYNINKELELCEISYSFVDTAIYHCPGYWDKNMHWHEGHYWPQYFQLMDALKMPGMRQPEVA
jgi:hypothetical protein